MPAEEPEPDRRRPERVVPPRTGAIGRELEGDRRPHHCLDCGRKLVPIRYGDACPRCGPEAVVVERGRSWVTKPLWVVRVIRHLHRVIGERPFEDTSVLAETARELFRDMVRARVFDDRALGLQRRGWMAGYPPFCSQEASQVGCPHDE